MEFDRRKFLQGALATVFGTAALASSPTTAFAASEIKVGVLIPLSGPGGLFGPASQNSAEMVFEEINARGGVNGATLVPVFVDAGAAPAEVSKEALRLWKAEGIEVFIGMHDGGVREAVRAVFKGQVLYLHPPTYEGGFCDPGMIAFGETPSQLLGESLKYLSENKGANRWYLIGNDYNWPRDSNAAAKDIIAANGGEVVGEEYLPFTVDNFDANIAKIKDSGANAVFITLVGGISVNFNRVFASFGLQKDVLRLGTLIEENTLQGIGAENSDNLYALGAYFKNIDSPENAAFVKAYHDRFGADAAVLNHLSEGIYESGLFLEALANAGGGATLDAVKPQLEGLAYDSPRGKNVYSGGNFTRDIHLMKADGAEFAPEAVFTQMPHGESCS